MKYVDAQSISWLPNFINYVEAQFFPWLPNFTRYVKAQPIHDYLILWSM